MKTTYLISALILLLGIGSASARTPWDQLNDSAPRAAITDIQDTAARTIFDEIGDSAPVHAPDAEPHEFAGE
jgi:hypothetical protein